LIFSRTNGVIGRIGDVIEGVAPSEIAKIYIGAAQELLLKEKWEEGSKLLRQALQYEPKSMTAFNNLMVIESRLGNYEAIDSLAQMWRNIHSDDPSALANLDNLLRVIESQRQE